MKVTDQKWKQRFLQIAFEVSKWSKDSTQVGSVLVSPDGLIISTGYNGLPRGVQDLPERMGRPQKYLWTVHSEEAAIANAARHGSKTSGALLFCTHQPCSRCARQIINAGIQSVHVGSGSTSMPQEEFLISKEMFSEAGIFQEFLYDPGVSGR